MLVGLPVVAQKQTMARLNRALDVDVSPSVTSSHALQPKTEAERPSASLVETPLSRAAARALFVHSDLAQARVLSAEALRQNRNDAEALFVKMEAAGMQGELGALLDAAIRLCETAGVRRQDARIQLAASRVREAAANTREFRAEIPRIQAVLASSDGSWQELNEALLTAAMDGAPGLDPYAISRAAGILTDWRVVGPLGRQWLAEFDKAVVEGSAGLDQTSYRGRAAEDFQFPDGTINLPDYLSRRGVFYGSSTFASLTASRWTLKAETSGMLEIAVDGKVVVHQAQLTQHAVTLSATLDLSPGPHRVLAKFTGSAAPLRIQVTPQPVERSETATLRGHISTQELAYTQAAEDYAEGDSWATVEQLRVLAPAMTNASVLFLLAQAESVDSVSPTMWDSTAIWRKLLDIAPAAFSAHSALAKISLANQDYAQAAFHAQAVLAVRPSDAAALEVLTNLAAMEYPRAASGMEQPAQLWAARLAEHPSCNALEQAVSFYRKRLQFEQASAAQRSLDGCAPESLAYARSLADQGNAKEAAEALRKLVAGAPLNRAARLMLVRELQLSGQDVEAQKAAAEWLHIAPNAASYRRLATLEEGAAAGESVTGNGDLEQQPFYAPYQRDVSSLAREGQQTQPVDQTTVLLNDHVAIARADGSVSLYVHRATRIGSQTATSNYSHSVVPEDAQVLRLRRIAKDGEISVADVDTAHRDAVFGALAPGDTVEEEYVVNYSGDGGIAEHSEAFQFVFGSFDAPVVHARFVVLTTADQADQGVVIATGDAPKMASRLEGGMLARVWDKNRHLESAGTSAGLAIVRVVEQEHGWTVPRNAERQRKIETIHPGPHFEES